MSVPNFHGFSALAVFSSVCGAFFTPQIGGRRGSSFRSTSAADRTPFRIDHDEKFNLTTHLQYQPWKTGPWFGFNWRYDSGLVAGATPCYGGNCPHRPLPSIQPRWAAIGRTDGLRLGAPLTADQEFESGLFCGSQRATPTTQIGVLGPPGSAALVVRPAIRVYASVTCRSPNGGRRHRTAAHRAAKPFRRFHRDMTTSSAATSTRSSLQLTAINLTNKYALYNFLSTFSGTHYVTPRSITAQIGFHF